MGDEHSWRLLPEEDSRDDEPPDFEAETPNGDPAKDEPFPVREPRWTGHWALCKYL